MVCGEVDRPFCISNCSEEKSSFHFQEVNCLENWKEESRDKRQKNFWPFWTMKICSKVFAQVGSQFCQKRNSYSRNGQKLIKIMPEGWNFAKSDHTGLF